MNYLRRNDKNSYIKAFDLIREIMVNPRDRMIYTIYEYKKEIDISSCVGHYE